MVRMTCFVIMPFSKTSEKHTEIYWNNFFELIKSEMELKQFICERSETGPHNILKHIIEKISESDLVISVLTDMNPNVWYELGIRHSLRNGTLMLIEDTHKIPFDISSYGLIRYSDDISLSNRLRKEIESYLDKLKGNKYFDSPVLDFLDLPSRHKGKIDEMYELVLKIANEKSEKKIEKYPMRKVKYNRILWVDDYPSNNEQIINIFESKNVRFDIAISTEQGIKLLVENEYDLVITDMGRGTEPDAGLQLIRRINRLENKNIPPIVVFASYQAIEKYGHIAIELGATEAFNGMGKLISYISSILLEKE